MIVLYYFNSLKIRINWLLSLYKSTISNFIFAETESTSSKTPNDLISTESSTPSISCSVYFKDGYGCAAEQQCRSMHQYDGEGFIDARLNGKEVSCEISRQGNVVGKTTNFYPLPHNHFSILP